MLAYDREAVPLGEVLDRQVALLREAHRAGDPVAAKLLRGTGTKGTDEELSGPATPYADPELDEVGESG